MKLFGTNLRRIISYLIFLYAFPLTLANAKTPKPLRNLSTKPEVKGKYKKQDGKYVKKQMKKSLVYAPNFSTSVYITKIPALQKYNLARIHSNDRLVGDWKGGSPVWVLDFDKENKEPMKCTVGGGNNQREFSPITNCKLFKSPFAVAFVGPKPKQFKWFYPEKRVYQEYLGIVLDNEKFYYEFWNKPGTSYSIWRIYGFNKGKLTPIYEDTAGY
ncbi:MAG: hypothetical protein AB8G05_18210 [Oligoflexales bacterium]